MSLLLVLAVVRFSIQILTSTRKKPTRVMLMTMRLVSFNQTCFLFYYIASALTCFVLFCSSHCFQLTDDLGVIVTGNRYLFCCVSSLSNLFPLLLVLTCFVLFCSSHCFQLTDDLGVIVTGNRYLFCCVSSLSNLFPLLLVISFGLFRLYQNLFPFLSFWYYCKILLLQLEVATSVILFLILHASLMLFSAKATVLNLNLA